MKIMYTSRCIWGQILLLLQYFLWMQLIDRIARGVASTEDTELLDRYLKYYWFAGIEAYTYSRSAFDYLLFFSYKRYGHTWSPYGAAHNLIDRYRCGSPHCYRLWLKESGWRILGHIYKLPNPSYELLIVRRYLPVEL